MGQAWHLYGPLLHTTGIPLTRIQSKWLRLSAREAGNGDLEVAQEEYR